MPESQRTPFMPPYTFHIPAESVPALLAHANIEPTARSGNVAYVILTLDHFTAAFPDLDPAHHVCGIFTSEDLGIEAHDLESVMLHMELILDEYNQCVGADPPWTMEPDAQFDFDTATRLVALLRLMSDPQGDWDPNYRELTAAELMDKVSLQPSDIWRQTQ